MADEHAQRESERVERALRHAGAGTWEILLPSRRIRIGASLRRLLDADDRELPDCLEALEARIHPADLERFRAALERQIDDPGRFDVIFRARGRGGRFVWFHATGAGERCGGGEGFAEARRGGGADGAAPPERAAPADPRPQVCLSGIVQLADHHHGFGREGPSTGRAEFIAAMSHEIRTPMTAILGFADILRDSTIGPTEIHAAAEAIHRNGEHLLKIVSDILDLSRIEAGAMTLEEVAVPPIEVAADVCESLRPRATAAGLELVLELLGPVPSLIRTDPTRLRQILFNLVDNAIRFTDHGYVRIGLERGPGETIRFHVTDTGIGVAPEHVDRIFRPFVQVHAPSERRRGGTGLGLDISRRLARMLGGDVTVRSTPGRGSTFTAEVSAGPLAGVPHVTSISERAASAAGAGTAGADRRGDGALPERGLRILLAEDGADSRRLLSHHLERFGMTVTAVGDGGAAVDEVAAARRRGEEFDVILVDMQMPSLDGPDAARAIRAAGFEGPIVALTAHDVTQARERCLDAGCDDVLAKPIERAQLLEAIRRHGRERPGRPR